MNTLVWHTPPRRRHAPLFAGLSVVIVAAVFGVAFDRELYVLAAAGVLALVLLGTALPLEWVQSFLLLTLMLVPEAVSHVTLGLHITWSQGLTLSNFVVPALALPLLAGAWVTGGRPWASLPVLARGYLWLLLWCALSLLPVLARSTLNSAELTTLAGHWIKLLLFVLLGAAVAPSAPRMRERCGALFLAGMAVNAAVGCLQMIGWFPVFSPLAASQSEFGVRASGLFYDANMYAVLCAWTLLWVCVLVARARGTRRLGLILFAVAIAANLAGAASRAGFLALLVGLAAFIAFRRGRELIVASLILLSLLAVFHRRSWPRLRSAVAVVESSLAGESPWSSAARDEGTQKRLTSAREAWIVLAPDPFFGVGFGRALYLGLPASDPSAGFAARFNGAQNMFLTVWVETGLPGLLLFLTTLAATLRTLWRLRLTQQRDWAIATMAGLIGLLAASLTLELLWNARLLALVIVLTAPAYE